MFTAEPARKKAYSSDLRWRIVYQRIARNLTFEKIAKNLSISTATAPRIYTQFHRTGGIEVTQQAGEHNLRRLTDRAELYVVGLVLANPPLYLSEMCQSVKSTFDIEVSPSTIYRLLQRYGLTRKKKGKSHYNDAMHYEEHSCLRLSCFSGICLYGSMKMVQTEEIV